MLFFFQAEDGIRDTSVTGVQTCALPISLAANSRPGSSVFSGSSGWRKSMALTPEATNAAAQAVATRQVIRSEERRVGKEGRSLWAPLPLEKRAHEHMSKRQQRERIHVTT